MDLGLTEIKDALGKMTATEHRELSRFLQEIDAASSKSMPPPEDLALPLFVYGALKPGLPAYEQLQGYVADARSAVVSGQLWVRDGLPLLRIDEPGEVYGFLLRWKPGSEMQAYNNVCLFEPRNHYQWSTVTVDAGSVANVLLARRPKKANPVFLDSCVWRLCDDPAFGPALDEIQTALSEIESTPPSSKNFMWRRFFRAQMAYLLLWSVLERLAAFCFGPGNAPMQRITRLHELEGIPEALLKHVSRIGETVADTRNPAKAIKLDPSNPQGCFDYYYTVRSNLSHRGKAVFDDFDKVYSSLKELLSVTREYLDGLRKREMALS
jgi:gamma-glutamylcyclotransferase (GGCT)/AIG2-like uncharacterized protein YtfP